MLDGQPYSTAYVDYTYNTLPITWEQCYLRSWLNSTFLSTAFTAGEQTRINTTLVDNCLPKDLVTFPESGSITGGNNTLDKIYILSYDEVIRYFPMKDIWYSSLGYPVNYDKLLQATATPYAIKQGVDVWSAKDAASCISYGGGYKNIAYDVIGYVAKWALRTPYGSQTCIYNVGASGSFGYRQATYDNATRPCMKISIK